MSTLLVNTKIQTPNTKQIPIFKFQLDGCFGVCLDLVSWCLVFCEVVDYSAP